jgi:hypothetical protein
MKKTQKPVGEYLIEGLRKHAIEKANEKLKEKEPKK